MAQKTETTIRSRTFGPWVIILSASFVASLIIIRERHNTPIEISADQLRIRSRLSTLAVEPNWNELGAYQKTITKRTFLDHLTKVYSEREAWRLAVKVHEDYADIRSKGNSTFRLHFGKSDSTTVQARYWRKAIELPQDNNLEQKPLTSLKVAIDPGHIGGQWAKMEERWYQINNTGTEIKEGELTLATAKLLKNGLEKLGAKVSLVRKRHDPVTALRPKYFEDLARKLLKSRGKNPEGLALRRESEILFYRKHEIRRRAQIINKKIKPDITLCLHFNAEAWGNPKNPQLVEKNHLHLLVNGAYSASEFRLEDNRFHLFKRLLQRTHNEEMPINVQVANAMAQETNLPPYVYTTPNAKLVDPKNRYIYARNLLANRIYHCPVIFLEPYVMNNKLFYSRVAEGNYPGKRNLDGKYRKSLIREYADGVINGLKSYYLKNRARKK